MGMCACTPSNAPRRGVGRACALVRTVVLACTLVHGRKPVTHTRARLRAHACAQPCTALEMRHSCARLCAGAGKGPCTPLHNGITFTHLCTPYTPPCTPPHLCTPPCTPCTHLARSRARFMERRAVHGDVRGSRRCTRGCARASTGVHGLSRCEEACTGVCPPRPTLTQSCQEFHREQGNSFRIVKFLPALPNVARSSTGNSGDSPRRVKSLAGLRKVARSSIGNQAIHLGGWNSSPCYPKLPGVPPGTRKIIPEGEIPPRATQCCPEFHRERGNSSRRVEFLPALPKVAMGFHREPGYSPRRVQFLPAIPKLPGVPPGTRKFIPDVEICPRVTQSCPEFHREPGNSPRSVKFLPALPKVARSSTGNQEINPMHIHVCIHACIHTCMHTYIHACIHMKQPTCGDRSGGGEGSTVLQSPDLGRFQSCRARPRSQNRARWRARYVQSRARGCARVAQACTAVCRACTGVHGWSHCEEACTGVCPHVRGGVHTCHGFPMACTGVARGCDKQQNEVLPGFA